MNQQLASFGVELGRAAIVLLTKPMTSWRLSILFIPLIFDIIFCRFKSTVPTFTTPGPCPSIDRFAAEDSKKPEVPYVKWVSWSGASYTSLLEVQTKRLPFGSLVGQVKIGLGKSFQCPI